MFFGIAMQEVDDEVFLCGVVFCCLDAQSLVQVIRDDYVDVDHDKLAKLA
jgi:hypothetical protein